MNNSLRSLDLDTEYRSAQSDLARTFYRQCLSASTRYDRSAGYFRSSVFLILGSQLVDFARRGGKMRLICSPHLSEDDCRAIEVGRGNFEQISKERLLQELDDMISQEDLRYPVKALSTLVSLGIIEVRVAIRTSGDGIYHEKLGLFSDRDDNCVSFIGSANETWRGWHPEGNYEAIEVFRSWKDEPIRLYKHRLHFDRIWNGHDPSLRTIPFPEAALARLQELAAPTLNDLQDEAPEKSAKPYKPRQHQAAAIQSWKLADCRGIFKHATGSGKTLTACFSMSDQVANGLPVVILVPSKLLLDQWEKELREFFPEAQILTAGAGNNSWREPGLVRSITSADPLLGPRILLATIQTARTDTFLLRIRSGAHLLLIVDEVHQAGSAENSRVLTIDAGQRLGLSATPERYGDPAGTKILFDYFGGILPPEYGLADAISDGNLVPYTYHPESVVLTPSESDEWSELTRQIRQIAARMHASSAISERSDLLEHLLIRRARIAKKAASKATLCQHLLRIYYKSSQRWLVYCEDSDQLADVVREASKVTSDVMEYHTAMSADAKATLSWFESHGGILVAIACLDEGVNIPCISHAIVLASSQNPRQFIQRRGRILRLHPGKHQAHIFDVLVRPTPEDNDSFQDALLISEMRRAIEFAKSAINVSAIERLRQIAIASGLDPDTIADLCAENDPNHDEASDDNEP